MHLTRNKTLSGALHQTSNLKNEFPAVLTCKRTSEPAANEKQRKLKHSRTVSCMHPPSQGTAAKLARRARWVADLLDVCGAKRR